MKTDKRDGWAVVIRGQNIPPGLTAWDYFLADYMPWDDVWSVYSLKADATDEARSLRDHHGWRCRVQRIGSRYGVI